MPPDVLGFHEVVAVLGITPRRLTAIRNTPSKRRVPFPAPTDLACGPVWDRAEVEAWHRDRTGGWLDTLAAYRLCGNITRTADMLGIPRETARDRLHRIGVAA
jgi:hypothetical protein